jgi:hypothetical protein
MVKLTNSENIIVFIDEFKVNTHKHANYVWGFKGYPACTWSQNQNFNASFIIGFTKHGKIFIQGSQSTINSNYFK